MQYTQIYIRYMHNVIIIIIHENENAVEIYEVR